MKLSELSGPALRLAAVFILAACGAQTAWGEDAAGASDIAQRYSPDIERVRGELVVAAK